MYIFSIYLIIHWQHTAGAVIEHNLWFSNVFLSNIYIYMYFPSDLKCVSSGYILKNSISSEKKKDSTKVGTGICKWWHPVVRQGDTFLKHQSMYSRLQDIRDHKPQKSDFLEYLQWTQIVTDCMTYFSLWIWNVTLHSMTTGVSIMSVNAVLLNVVKCTCLSDFLIYQ